VQFENTLHEGCETLQTMNTISSRHDLTREQRMQSIVDLACQYLGVEIAVFSIYDGAIFIRSTTNSGQESLRVPLSEQHARQALDDGNILRFENHDKWQSYVACSIYISDQRTGLLEAGSPRHDSLEMMEHKTTLHTELGLQIFNLFVQWIANELLLSDYENSADTQYQQSKSRFVQMTDREFEVLQLVSNGESNKSIARILNISTKTVELHRSNLLRKTNSSSSVQLIKLATQSGIVY
jgi:DNA-binding CsgD family transcriptional regulator